METRDFILCALNVLCDAAGTPDGPVGSSQAARELRQAIRDFRDNTDPWPAVTVVGIPVGALFVHASVGYTEEVQRWVVREMWRLSGHKLAEAPAPSDLIVSVMSGSPLCR